MWSNFKFYIAILLMCIGCLLPVAIFKLPEESISGAGALVVFFAGGGLLYSFYSFFMEEYDGEWTDTQRRILPIMSVIFTVIALTLQFVVLKKYDGSSFGLVNLFIDYNGNVKEFYLRLLTFIFSGLSLYPLFTMATGNVDTEEYLFKRTYYYNGQEIKSEYVSKSCDESKVAYFFTSVMMAMVGLMASSLPVIVIVLGLNMAMLLKGKVKNIVAICGVAIAIVLTIINVRNAYNVSDVESINVAMEILPLVFSILTALFLVGYFKIEWFSNSFIIVIATFVMLYISWLASLGITNLILK